MIRLESLYTSSIEFLSSRIKFTQCFDYSKIIDQHQLADWNKHKDVDKEGYGEPIQGPFLIFQPKTNLFKQNKSYSTAAERIKKESVFIMHSIYQ